MSNPTTSKGLLQVFLGCYSSSSHIARQHWLCSKSHTTLSPVLLEEHIRELVEETNSGGLCSKMEYNSSADY